MRLARIDTPELRTKDEWEKRAGVIVRDILVQRIGDKVVELDNVDHDKYGRILAEIICDGHNVSDWLLDSGWACPYGGSGEKMVKNTEWKQKVLEYETADKEP